MSNILNLIFPLLARKDRNQKLYEDFKQERPEEIPKIKQFGVKSLIYSCLSVVIGVLCILGVVLCIRSLNPFFMIFGTIFMIYLFFSLSIVINIMSIKLWVLQLKCNKKAIGWVAMSIWILCTILTIVVPLLIATLFK